MKNMITELMQASAALGAAVMDGRAAMRASAVAAARAAVNRAGTFPFDAALAKLTEVTHTLANRVEGGNAPAPQSPVAVNAYSLGLGQVNNTPDVFKPVSLPQAQALRLKADNISTYTKVEISALLSSSSGSGSDGSMTLIAAEAIGGHRAVRLDTNGKAQYASRALLNHLGCLAGVSQSAVLVNETIIVTVRGLMTEPSWAWEPDAPVYLGEVGLLTQTPPTQGFIQIIGMALSATTLFVNPRDPLAVT